MDDTGGLIIFWVIIGAVIGGLIGASRNNVISGLFWGGLLGPIGWLGVLFLDERPKCPECRGPLSNDARRCQHCGFVFGIEPELARLQASRETNKVAAVESDKKKCPFCAELIQREAIKCRFCGSDLTEKPEITKPTVESNQTPAPPTVEPPPKTNPRREDAEVHFECPACGQPVSTDAAAAGQEFPCPECGLQLEVPRV